MNKILKEMIGMAVYLLIVLLATWFIITYIGQRTVVDGSSMEPTLSNNNQLIVDKVSYRFTDPKRFDIIVFPFEYQKDTYYIKRIIGLPGETVQIDEEGNIYINDKKLEENYGKETIRADHIGRAGEPITLGEDEYFVMGDNRNDSSDSRTEAVGNIKRGKIIGRAWVRIWPLNKFGGIKSPNGE